MNGERFFAKLVRIALAKLRKFYFGESTQGCADL
jgi:hypothetical protein